MTQTDQTDLTETQRTTTTRATSDGGYADLPALLSRMSGDEKHDQSSLSTLEVIWTLYDRVLDVAPDRTDDPDRDRFLLSKGHGPMAYYAVLAAKGFLDPAELDTWTRFDSRLGGHPDRKLVPGVEISSGSLGHGLGLGVGTAHGLRLQGRTRPRVVVLVGDGELDEGSNLEAIQYAGRAGLGNLTVVVVDNESAQLGWPGGIAARFEVEGWTATDVDGLSQDAVERAFARTEPRDVPHVVVAHIDPQNDPQNDTQNDTQSDPEVAA